MEKSYGWGYYKSNIFGWISCSVLLITTIFFISQIKKDEPIPADIILLRSSDKNGLCYIETKNLDGETNLKSKVTHKKLLEIFKSDDDVILIYAA